MKINFTLQSKNIYFYDLVWWENVFLSSFTYLIKNADKIMCKLSDSVMYRKYNVVEHLKSSVFQILMFSP